MESLFSELHFWHWFILGIGLIILETFAPGEIFLWTGIGALATGVVAFALPGLEWQQQSMVFAALAVVSLFAGRTWFRRRETPSDHPTLNQRGDQYLGRRFVLDEPIANGFGRMKVGDSIWKIEGPDLKKGAKVVVTGTDGTILQVAEDGADGDQAA